MVTMFVSDKNLAPNCSCSVPKLKEEHTKLGRGK
jgi:hypothetical protein